MPATGATGLGGTHIIPAPPGGKYTRTKPSGSVGATGTMGPAKITTSQFKAIGDKAISGTTEASPIRG